MLKLPFLNNMIHLEATLKTIHNNLSLEKRIKFQFVMSSDVVYVLELIENGLHLFWDDLEAMRDNSTEMTNVNVSSSDHFHAQRLASSDHFCM